MIVVKNDIDKSYADPLFIELSSRPLNIRFAGCPHAKEGERRQTFLDGCFITKRLPIVIFIYYIYLSFIFCLDIKIFLGNFEQWSQF